MCGGHAPLVLGPDLQPVVAPIVRYHEADTSSTITTINNHIVYYVNLITNKYESTGILTLVNIY